jgi:hypothetical protein
MTDLTPLDTVPGVRGAETAHVRRCERAFSECAVCLSWWEELLTAARDGRVEIPDETEQTELPI